MPGRAMKASDVGAGAGDSAHGERHRVPSVERHARWVRALKVAGRTLGSCAAETEADRDLLRWQPFAAGP